MDRNTMLAVVVVGAGAYWWMYMRKPAYVAPVVAKPVAVNSDSFMGSAPVEAPPQAVAGESNSDGKISNAAASPEKYYGVGGVEFMTQGVKKSNMTNGPFFGPMMGGNKY